MPTTIVSGHGGWLTLYETNIDTGTDEDPAYDAVTINLDTWVGRWSCEYLAATPSGSGNGTLFLPTIAVNTWEASFPLDSNTDHTDDLVYGLVNTFFPGMPIYEIFFRRGNETWLTTVPPAVYNIYDKLERTTLTGIQFVDDNKGDAFRVMLTGMGGRLSLGYPDELP